MPELDFDESVIHIRPTGGNWGPYTFSFSGGLPTGATLSGESTVRAINVDTEEESTSLVIESGSISVSSLTMDVSFKFPGSDNLGLHRLAFDLSLNGAGRYNTVYFGHILAEED